MAYLKVSSALDMRAALGGINFAAGQVTATTATTIVLTLPGGLTAHLTGVVQSGDLSQSTITAIRMVKNNAPWFELSNVDPITLQQLRTLTGASFVANALSGNDTLVGSAQNDYLEAQSGDDSLYGAAGVDVLIGDAPGSAGADRLDGGSGGDSLFGGAGNDSYVVDTATDKVVEQAGGGFDTIEAAFTTTLVAEVEALLLRGTGAINGFGNALNNYLQGNAGNNTLDGKAGADTLAGGSGNDVYYLDNPGDTVVEAPGGGLDIVRALANGVTLGANVEALQLQAGVAWGSGSWGSDSLYGNAGANTLFGGSGADLLDGGSGGDSLFGGSGNDTFAVDTGTDRAFGGDGSDTVRTTASTTLGGGIENLVLLGSAKFGIGDREANVITGNNQANTLLGNSGADTLNGASGVDSLYGGSGNDLYLIDTATDKVTDIAGGGYDTVQANLSFTLGVEIEALILGGSAVSGTGNAINNIIQGNGANNTLDGKSGADTLIGGLGNDVYYLDNAGDTVFETQGLDIIRAQANGIALLAGVEVLQLQAGVAWGSGSLGGESLYGNAGANTLFGRSGADLLDGGSGGDSLYGGSGNDSFVIDTATDRAYGGDGFDTVRASTNATLGGGIESLLLLGSVKVGIGDRDDNAITGNAQANTLLGNSGADTLYGGSGGDSLYGGSGNDTFTIDTATDRIVDAAGLDTVYANRNLTLAAGLENGILTASAITLVGNDGDNSLTGNAAANVVFAGLHGNDWLNGGSGKDTLIGNADANTFVIDTVTDIIQSGGTGTAEDVVLSAAPSHDLAASYRLLQLLPGAVSGTALGVFQTLIGNDGNNLLYGGRGSTLDGGGGDDTLVGGLAGQTFIVDSLNDTIADNGIQDGDLVIAYRSYTLQQNVDHLQLVGANAYYGEGNQYNNTMVGSSFDNWLYGGAGIDWLFGGAGNDTIDGGKDTDSLYGGAGDDWLYGGSGSGQFSLLHGGEGNDVLFAGHSFASETNQFIGGLGVDHIYGGLGSGADSFVYQTAADSAAGAADTIFAFSAGDQLDLSAIDAIPGGFNDSFTYIGSGEFTDVGQLRFVNGRFEANLTGDAAADFVIETNLVSASGVVIIR